MSTSAPATRSLSALSGDVVMRWRSLNHFTRERQRSFRVVGQSRDRFGQHPVAESSTIFAGRHQPSLKLIDPTDVPRRLKLVELRASWLL